MHRKFFEITKTQFNCDKLNSFVRRKCVKGRESRVQIQVEHNDSRLLRTPRHNTQVDNIFFSFYFDFWKQGDTFHRRMIYTMIWMPILILLLIPTPFPIPFAMLIYATTVAYNPHLAFRRVLSQWQMKLEKCMHATMPNIPRMQQG